MKKQFLPWPAGGQNCLKRILAGDDPASQLCPHQYISFCVQATSKTGKDREDAYLYVQAQFGATFLDDLGQLVHTELLCKLIEHSELSSLCRIVDCQLDASHLSKHNSRFSQHRCVPIGYSKLAKSVAQAFLSSADGQHDEEA